MNLSARAGNRVREKAEAAGRLAGISLKSFVVFLLVGTTGALSYAYLENIRVHYTRKISQAVAQQRDLKEVARRLRVELNHLRAPQRLEREAEKLGLAKPDRERFRSLK